LSPAKNHETYTESRDVNERGLTRGKLLGCLARVARILDFMIGELNIQMRYNRRGRRSPFELFAELMDTGTG